MGSLNRSSEGIGRLVHGTAVYGIGAVLNRAVTFLLLPILTRFFRPDEYGLSAMLDLCCAALVALFSLGFGSSILLTYYDQEGRDHREATISTAFLTLVLSGSLLLGLGLVVPETLARLLLGDPAQGSIVRLSVIASLLMILPLPFSLRLQLEERASRLVALNLVSTVLVLTASLVGVVALGRGVQGLWEGRIVAYLVTFLLFATQFPLSRILRFKVRIARELLRLGLPMVPSFFSLFLLLQANRYILQWSHGLQVTGIYAVGVQIGMAMGLAVSAFSTAWTPYFMSLGGNLERAGRAIGRATSYFVLSMGGLTLLFFGGSRIVLLVAADPAYLDAYRVVGLAATAQLFLGIFNLLTPGASYAREVGWVGLIQVVAALLAVLLNVWCIARYGFLGAGVALAAGAVLMTAMLALWNLWRRGRYVDVCYEPRRLTAFAAYFIVAGWFLTRSRAWSIGSELLLFSGVLAATAVCIWLLLEGSERVALQHRVRSWSTSLRGVQA